MELPAPVGVALARAIAAYIRDAPKKDVPAHLRRVEGFRPQALKPFHKDLIAALDDDDFRNGVAEWLDRSPSLKKDEARVLAIAVARKKGWQEELSAAPARAKAPAKSEAEKLRAELDRERARTAKLKEESRLQREAARSAEKAAKQKVTDLQKEARESAARVRSLEAEVKSLRADLKRERQNNEKERRALRREADRAIAARSKAEESVPVLKRDVAARERKIRELEDLLDKERTRARSQRKPAPSASKPQKRRKLSAPKGLLEDAPETLQAWLASDGVQLVVDGYNLGKEGYPEIEDLGPVRKRVVDRMVKLARRYSIEAVVVFDGAEVAPGTARRRQGPVKILYSPPDVIADDVIVDLVEEMPARPVIVVTNDRGLQSRVAKLGATVATSTQFLALTSR